MTPEEWAAHLRRVDESIAQYNSALGEKRSRFNSEYRKRLIEEAVSNGMPQGGIDYIRRGKWN